MLPILNENSRNFAFKLYDKRIWVAILPSRVRCGYGVVKSELKRYAKLSSKFSDFIVRKDLLFSKLIDTGYMMNKINHIYQSLDLYL